MFKTTTGFKATLGGLIVAFGFNVLPVAEASAQQMCGKRTDVVQSLSAEYKESTTGVGLVNNGMVIEVLTSKTGSWTILMTRTNGVSCVVATGNSWESVDLQIASGPAA